MYIRKMLKNHPTQNVIYISMYMRTLMRTYYIYVSMQGAPSLKVTKLKIKEGRLAV